MVTVPGRLKALMPRASGSRPSSCCNTDELPNAAAVPAPAATRPARIKRRRRRFTPLLPPVLPARTVVSLCWGETGKKSFPLIAEKT